MTGGTYLTGLDRQPGKAALGYVKYYISVSDLHVISYHSLSYLLISVREIDASPPDSGGEFSTTQVISLVRGRRSSGRFGDTCSAAVSEVEVGPPPHLLRLLAFGTLIEPKYLPHVRASCPQKSTLGAIYRLGTVRTRQ